MFSTGVVLVATMLLFTDAVEIDLLEDFNINGDMENIVQIDGLPYEGRAFTFGDVKKHLVREDLASEIAKQATVYGGLTFTGNVKIYNNQECALLWIETIYGHPVFGIWVTCKAFKCDLTMLHRVRNRAYDVNIENVGPLYDGRWHKLVVHVTGMRRGEKSSMSVYVDCAKQGEKPLVPGYSHLLPFYSRKPAYSRVWLAQRSRGYRKGFERPWKGSVQNLKFVFNRDIKTLTNHAACASLAETRRKQYGPPIVRKNKPEDGSTNDPNPLQAMAVHMDQLQQILQNQVKETQYLRRVIENFYYSDKKAESCNLNPCYPGVTCSNTPGLNPGYKCGECPIGMEGDGINCTNIDECKYEPCFPGVNCENHADGYKCGPCPIGYRGGAVRGNGVGHARIKQECEDVDECAKANTCSRFSECINVPGSYKCGACQDGFYGNPYTECKKKTFCMEDQPPSNPCDKNAYCISKHQGRSYQCACKLGFVGNGVQCATDSDMDGVPDYALSCSGVECAKDNCYDFPNPDQSDVDKDGEGDACDNDIDGDGIPNDKDNCPKVANGDQKASDSDSFGDACDNCPFVPNEDQMDSDGVGQGNACDRDIDNDGIINRRDNCPLVKNSDQEDRDRDGVGDACDNCPKNNNPDQEDTDLDFVGDVCDNDKDRDQDGVQDSVDNCPSKSNAAQLDHDKDTRGDSCDNDDDNDAVIDIHDNCPFLKNRDQRFSAAFGRGKECKHDFDNDGVKDRRDACSRDASMSAVDFRKHIVFRPGRVNPEDKIPQWKVENQGREVRKEIEDGDSFLVGNRAFESVEFNSTMYVDSDKGAYTVGLVFGFQNTKLFYIAMWKKGFPNQGLVVKEVSSSSGLSEALHNALKNSRSVYRQVKILWEDSKKTTWNHRTPYKWVLNLNARRKRIKLDVFKGKENIISSPVLYAGKYHGGRLGMFSFSPGKVIWTALAVKCLHV